MRNFQPRNNQPGLNVSYKKKMCNHFIYLLFFNLLEWQHCVPKNMRHSPAIGQKRCHLHAHWFIYCFFVPSVQCANCLKQSFFILMRIDVGDRQLSENLLCIVEVVFDIRYPCIFRMYSLPYFLCFWPFCQNFVDMPFI